LCSDNPRIFTGCLGKEYCGLMKNLPASGKLLAQIMLAVDESRKLIVNSKKSAKEL